MAFDLDLIQKVYQELPEKIDTVRKFIGRPLTQAEKILYAHTFEAATKAYERGRDYVNFAPDRVAMQDATAQMALLQFMTCGRDRVDAVEHRHRHPADLHRHHQRDCRQVQHEAGRGDARESGRTDRQ